MKEKNSLDKLCFHGEDGEFSVDCRETTCRLYNHLLDAIDKNDKNIKDSLREFLIAYGKDCYAMGVPVGEAEEKFAQLITYGLMGRHTPWI
ncbi:hypothetical protein [Selenomonas sp. KH1T6]|uniref:hypothetical protein n=1 Tax=Selenomonas sp. KH1T6 TaxID=3158784 RepID=UPI0008A76DA7|nr:hypothetical protein SAMN05216583_103162 [Selenomonas ruminantium]